MEKNKGENYFDLTKVAEELDRLAIMRELNLTNDMLNFSLDQSEKLFNSFNVIFPLLSKEQIISLLSELNDLREEKNERALIEKNILPAIEETINDIEDEIINLFKVEDIKDKTQKNADQKNKNKKRKGKSNKEKKKNS